MTILGDGAALLLGLFTIFAVLTGVGSTRRHDPWGVVALSAAAWPITWAVWYVVDRRRQYGRYCSPAAVPRPDGST